MRSRLEEGSFIAALVDATSDCPDLVRRYVSAVRKLELRRERVLPFSYADICQVARACDMRKSDRRLPPFDGTSEEVDVGVGHTCGVAQARAAKAPRKKK
jgi:hypothetical protein